MKKVFWYIFAPLRFLYKVYFGIVFLITAIPMYPIFLVLLKDDTKTDQAFKVKRVWARIICALTLVKVMVKGQENLPPKPYVICANHASYLDILVMACIIPETFLFLGKAELLKWPIIKVFFKNMDIPVDRSNKKKAAHSIELTKQAIQKGYSVAIFPEGLIPDYDVPKLHKFKRGAFVLATSQQVPIVPVTFVTNWAFFSHHGDLLGKGSPGVSKSVIHEPIPTKGLTEKNIASLIDKTFKVIEKPLLKYYKAEWK
jgi:1-acyl-sn-glycerol-3-phosphate acyltransferase